MFASTLAALVLLVVTPPTGVSAVDRPNDGGRAIIVTWTRSPDPVTGYRILRQPEGGEAWDTVGFTGPRLASFVDEGTPDGVRSRYRVLALTDGEPAESEPSGYAVSTPQWFNTNYIPALVFTFVFGFLIIFFLRQAKRGAKLFMRRIAGLDAVEEALGRATEMGRPILYVPGLSSIDDVATIASINILGEVAKKTAKFGTPLIVPNRDPIVYTVARETVKQSYTEAGRPDAFHQDIVFFVTDQQFAYAAAVDGIMTREKPATNFLIGMFWAESLILAETGAMSGAVQIAGTDALSQLPFFITACDYTLIGEELYAASAYLSREPVLLGAIKGQDYSKALILVLIIVGTLLAVAFRAPVLELL
ncbi:fibronectin type III domain-containing protein [candidate division WOR-3 bacterium]|nr:fibronectin type III domain-containing protein [candidate division WOR-3 bacterium]